MGGKYIKMAAILRQVHSVLRLQRAILIKMTKVHILFLAFVAASVGHIQALTEEDIGTLKTKFTPIIAECAEKYETTLEEVIAAKKAGKDDNNPCIIACVFKKMGITSEDGKLNVDEAKKFIEESMKDEEFAKKTTEAVEACETVNDEEVTGDEEACQRADLLKKCFKKTNVWLA